MIIPLKIKFAVFFIILSSFNSSPVYYQLMELIQTQPTKEQFKLWHYVNQKPYDLNTNQAILRYKSFKKNAQIIKETNEQNLGYTLGLTTYADYTHEEFVVLMGKYDYDFHAEVKKNLNFDEMADKEDKTEHVEAKELKGFVSKDHSKLYPYAKDQKYCGSCWSFSTIATLEGFALLKGLNLRLSEQQLIDCNVKNHGCDGGNYEYSFQYVSDPKNGGIILEADYPTIPYAKEKEKKRVCKSKWNKPALKVNGYVSCFGSECKESVLEQMLSNGPYSGSIQTANQYNFHLHRQGTWKVKYCDKPDHAIQILKVDTNKKEVVMRNSWGDWGVNGVATIDYSLGTGAKACGLLEMAYQPKSVERAN